MKLAKRLFVSSIVFLSSSIIVFANPVSKEPTYDDILPTGARVVSGDDANEFFVLDRNEKDPPKNPHTNAARMNLAMQSSQKNILDVMATAPGENAKTTVKKPDAIASASPAKKHLVVKNKTVASRHHLKQSPIASSANENAARKHLAVRNKTAKIKIAARKKTHTNVSAAMNHHPKARLATKNIKVKSAQNQPVQPAAPAKKNATVNVAADPGSEKVM